MTKEDLNLQVRIALELRDKIGLEVALKRAIRDELKAVLKELQS